MSVGAAFLILFLALLKLYILAYRVIVIFVKRDSVLSAIEKAYEHGVIDDEEAKLLLAKAGVEPLAINAIIQTLRARKRGW